jgi:hypothetical protein
MIASAIAPIQALRSRKVVNAIYLFVPPLGLLFMCLSPFFSARERLFRGLMTASCLMFFATMGPTLQAYTAQQVALLHAQQAQQTP